MKMNNKKQINLIYDSSINIQQCYLIQMTDRENKNIRPIGILALCRLPRLTLKLLIHTGSGGSVLQYYYSVVTTRSI